MACHSYKIGADKENTTESREPVSRLKPCSKRSGSAIFMLVGCNLRRRLWWTCQWIPLSAVVFDNRIGGFMIAEVARLLKENKRTPYALYVVNAVQEEIGLRVQRWLPWRIKPDVAIITDVTHDSTTPMINKLRRRFVPVVKARRFVMALQYTINCSIMFSWLQIKQRYRCS